MTTEIKALGNMLAATTAHDAPRLLAISKRVAQIAGANPGTVTDQDGNVHLESEPPCRNCKHPGPETFQNGAWRCPECFGMGWVPSKTEADTDPCPKCEGGFSAQNSELSQPASVNNP